MKDILVIDKEAFDNMIKYIDDNLLLLDNFKENKNKMDGVFGDIGNSEVLYEYKLMMSKLINMVDDYYKMVKKAVDALYTIGINLGKFDTTVSIHTTLSRDYDMIWND